MKSARKAHRHSVAKVTNPRYTKKRKTVSLPAVGGVSWPLPGCSAIASVACTCIKFKINNVDMESDHHPLPKYQKNTALLTDGDQNTYTTDR